MTKHAYDRWAQLYNDTMGPDYGRQQLALLEQVLLADLPERAEILDLCCGTGQMIQPLLEAGYRVTGLDASAEMLTCARQNAPAATFVQEDARKYRENNRFDAAFSTSASLNHIPNLDDLTQVFGNVSDSLKEAGNFVFDLNHPEQLAKWWRGRPTEGDLTDRCVWMVTPSYDESRQQGAFRVTIFTPPARSSAFKKLFTALKRPLYRLLRLPRFIGLRLKLINNFQRWEPSWQRQEMDFPIAGHDLDAVRTALKATGFAQVEIVTIDGKSTVDADYSAHFVCRKVAE